MRRLSREKRAQILHLLCEGSAIRAIARVSGASRKTIGKLLVDAGQACAAYQDQAFRDLSCKRLQVDEIWSFVYAKQANVKRAKKAPAVAGDVWTWTAICADSKLVPSWRVGTRDGATAADFVGDLETRLAGRVQLTSDGNRTYLEPIEDAFGAEIDYAQLIKLYGRAPEAERRYSPSKCVGCRKEIIEGEPDPKHINTSYVERNNLTMRMHMRRFTRLTNAFSKKIENLEAAVALHFMYYNFVRIHSAHRLTPAMAASVTDRLWDMHDLVTVLEKWEYGISK